MRLAHSYAKLCSIFCSCSPVGCIHLNVQRDKVVVVLWLRFAALAVSAGLATCVTGSTTLHVEWKELKSSLQWLMEDISELKGQNTLRKSRLKPPRTHDPRYRLTAIGACRPGHARALPGLFRSIAYSSQGPDAKTRGMPSDQHNRAYARTDVRIAYSVVTIRFLNCASNAA